MARPSRAGCWGALLALGLQLPATVLAAPIGGQSRPTSAATAQARAPWEPAWSERLAPDTDLLLAVTRNHVFTAGTSSPLEARDADTGAIAWTHETTGWTALAATGDLVLGVADEHAYALEADTGQVRWIVQTTGPTTRLVVSGDRLLMVSDTDVLLRETSTGVPLGHVGLDAPPSATPALTGSLAFVPLTDGRLVAFDLAAGLQLWSSQLRRPPAAITAAGDSLFLALPDGSLQAVDARSGAVRWTFPLRVPIVGAPFVDDTTVYVVLLDNSLRAFDRRNGAMRRTDGLGHRPAAGPWVTGSSAVIGLTTGDFLVIDPASGRLLTRLSVPETDTTSLLESAALGPETFWLASVTIAPGGERRLSAYRHNPPATVTTTETVTGPLVPDDEPETTAPERDVPAPPLDEPAAPSPDTPAPTDDPARPDDPDDRQPPEPPVIKEPPVDRPPPPVPRPFPVPQ